MFVDDPTLAPFRALATKIAGTVSLSFGRTTNEVDHVHLVDWKAVNYSSRITTSLAER